jgi:hypothetical protein
MKDYILVVNNRYVVAFGYLGQWKKETKYPLNENQLLITEDEFIQFESEPNNHDHVPTFSYSFLLHWQELILKHHPDFKVYIEERM